MLCIVVDSHLSVFGHRNEYDPTPQASKTLPPSRQQQKLARKQRSLRFRTAESQIKNKNSSLEGQAELWDWSYNLLRDF
jgi:hypothetical protein